MTKLDASGAALGYSTYLGGSGDDDGDGIAVDGAGSAYVTGATASTNFPTTAGAFDTTYNGVRDAFVTKLDASGAALGYSTYLGGSGDDRGLGHRARRRRQRLRDRDHGLGGLPDDRGRLRHDLQRRRRRLRDEARRERRRPRLLHLPGRKRAGYDAGLYGDDIALDAAGNAYLTGYTTSADFPTTAGAFDTTNDGAYDAFVTKLDVAGQTPAPPPPACQVPRVIGLRLGRARTRIRSKHCSVGRIRRVHSRRVGRVIAQSPRPGRRLARGSRVNLVLGRR